MTSLNSVQLKKPGKSDLVDDNSQKSDNPKKLVIVPPVPEKTSLADVYSAVSNDKGKLFDVSDIESEMLLFINENEKKEAHDINNLAVVISKGRVLYQAHKAKSEKAETIIDGISVKGKILEGMLLNIEQKLLRKKGKQWVAHYKQTYGEKSLRSAQDYMGLAGIDNILVYAPVGKERLLDVRRAMKALGIEGDDPIGTFLKNFEIPFNPKNIKGNESIEDLKMGIDYAVATTKISVAEEKNSVQLEVNLDLIKKLIGFGIKISNSLISDLLIIKNEGNEVNPYLEGLCSNKDGDDDTLAPIKKVGRLSSLVTGIGGAIEAIDQNADLAKHIDKDDVDELEEFVRKLKTLLERRAATE